MWQLVGCSCEEKKKTCGGVMTEGTQKGPREVDFVSCFSHAPHIMNPFSSVLAVHPWWLRHTSTSNHSRDPRPRLDIFLCPTIPLMFSEGFPSPEISLHLGPQPGWMALDSDTTLPILPESVQTSLSPGRPPQPVL